MLLFFLLIIISFTNGVEIHVDGCGIGAGPTGMAWAAFYKDLGRSVLLIEKEAIYGGNCNTVNLPGGDWLDIGTAAFSNSTLLKSINNVTDSFWSIDTAAFANRFSGGLAFALPPLGGASPPVYSANFKNGVQLNISTNPNFTAALIRLIGLVSQYPWLESADKPSPIPAELLLPFSTIIVNYQLEPLVDVFFPTFIFGTTDYNKTLALYALLEVKPALYAWLTVPNAVFSIFGGCVKIYDGIADYIGRQNILLSATIVDADRPANNTNQSIHLQVLAGVGDQKTFYDVYCKKMLVAYPLDSKTIKPLKPDSLEKDAFKDFEFKYVGAIAADIAGPITNTSFSLFNHNPNRPFDSPNAPCVQTIVYQLPIPGRPAFSYVASKKFLTNEEVLDIWNSQVDGIPSNLLTSATIRVLAPHAEYQPMITDPFVLAQPCNPFCKIHTLQGRKNTYWASTSVVAPDSALAWNFAYVMANRMHNETVA